MARLKSIEELAALRSVLEKEAFPSDRPRARVCCGTACSATGAHKVVESMVEQAGRQGIDLEVVKTGCQGLCQKGPVMRVEPMNLFYQRVKPDAAGRIVDYSLAGNLAYRENLYRTDILSQPVEKVTDVPFYKKQKRIALRNNGVVDPGNIEHYIAVGGYRAAEKMFSGMTPQQVLDEVDAANLRGRGGAGFPAGRKWKHVVSDPNPVKFVIANGDEGDPGAFMDRSIMEGDPHSLLEGMLISAFAVQARYGFIYVRHEYPMAVRHLKRAIEQAMELGLLGLDILGTGFDFEITVREGAGAFVCGESTALVASIEGQRGFPRPRPPRLSETGGGLWGYPSVLNNIETFACVPYILDHGAEHFRSVGTENSPGTKVFALTGKVKNTGLVEVPMGITLREIIYDIGGGILNDKAFKAVQTGGPSGGCLPADMLDLQVDFDSLKKVGSMMGSGGMVVLDEDNCMVDVAKFFLSFTQAESCGKCPPCRIGTAQMLEILERITSGRGVPEDLDRLERLGRDVQAGSLCGLGQSAPNPILSTLKYFREEYEEHIHEGYCRAKTCRGLGAYRIEFEECIACGLCAQACAFDAVVETKDRFYIDRDYCQQCKACYTVCPTNAVKIEKGETRKKEAEVGVTR